MGLVGHCKAFGVYYGDTGIQWRLLSKELHTLTELHSMNNENELKGFQYGPAIEKVCQTFTIQNVFQDQ
jgi:hypothetical protein